MSVRTFDSIYDGHIEGYSVVSYNEARTKIAGDVISTTTQWVGQYYSIAWARWRVFRSFFFFDTSTVLNVNSATFNFYRLGLYADIAFSLVIQKGPVLNGGQPHNPLVVNDYYYAHYSGNYGSATHVELGSGPGAAGAGWYSISLNTAIINPGNETHLVLRVDSDIDGTFGGNPGNEQKQYLSITDSIPVAYLEIDGTFIEPPSGNPRSSNVILIG